MGGDVRTDEQGRVTIPKVVCDRYGGRFRLVELDSCSKLVSIPDDPLEELRSAASGELREARSPISKKRPATRHADR